MCRRKSNLGIQVVTFRELCRNCVIMFSYKDSISVAFLMAGLIYLHPGQVKLKKNYNAVIQRYINIIAAQKIHNTYLAVCKSVVRDI